MAALHSQREAYLPPVSGPTRDGSLRWVTRCVFVAVGLSVGIISSVGIIEPSDFSPQSIAAQGASSCGQTVAQP